MLLLVLVVQVFPWLDSCQLNYISFSQQQKVLSAGGGFLKSVFHHIKLVQVSAEETDGKRINYLDSNHLEMKKIYVK